MMQEYTTGFWDATSDNTDCSSDGCAITSVSCSYEDVQAALLRQATFVEKKVKAKTYSPIHSKRDWRGFKNRNRQR